MTIVTSGAGKWKRAPTQIVTGLKKFVIPPTAKRRPRPFQRATIGARMTRQPERVPGLGSSGAPVNAA